MQVSTRPQNCLSNFFALHLKIQFWTMSGQQNRYLKYTNAEEQRSNVRSLFNNIAPTYDLLNTMLSFGIDKRWRKKAVSELGIDQHSTILDLATGTGELAREALRKYHCTIVGIDPARDMLKRTDLKLSALPGKFSPVEAFGEALPLANKKFSHAMISYGIRNVSDRPKVFSEIARILKPGGKFAILEFSDPKNKLFAKIYRFYFHTLLANIGGLVSGDRDAYTYLPRTVAAFVTPEELAAECEKAGFQIQLIKPMMFGITTLIILQKK